MTTTRLREKIAECTQMAFSKDDYQQIMSYLNQLDQMTDDDQRLKSDCYKKLALFSDIEAEVKPHIYNAIYTLLEIQRLQKADLENFLFFCTFLQRSYPVGNVVHNAIKQVLKPLKKPDYIPAQGLENTTKLITEIPSISQVTVEDLYLIKLSLVARLMVYKAFENDLLVNKHITQILKKYRMNNCYESEFKGFKECYDIVDKLLERKLIEEKENERLAKNINSLFKRYEKIIEKINPVCAPSISSSHK